MIVSDEEVLPRSHPAARAAGLTLLALAVALVLLGCGDDSAAPALPDDADAQLVEGAAVYERHCARCHANDGSGRNGPRLVGRVVDRYPDPADQIELVESGRRGMPPFGGRLSAEEIGAVVRYTREVLR